MLIEGPYRFFFWMNDLSEPPHVHVSREGRTAKFWLAPVRLDDTGRLRADDIRRIARIIESNEEAFLEEWNARLSG